VGELVLEQILTLIQDHIRSTADRFGAGQFFSARCNIYISSLRYDVSVRLSVTEVHWCIIANLGFKFRSQFTAH